MAQANVSDPEAVDTLLESLKTKYYIDRDRLEFPDKRPAGRGGFGVVSRTTLHPANEAATSSGLCTYGSEPGPRTVAVKELTNLTGIEAQRLKRIFTREVHVWSGISHPNILAFIGFYLDVTEPAAWLISEWEPFGNIKEYLGSKEVDCLQKLRFLHDTAQALAYLHSRTPPITHGDIKSANVLVTRNVRAVLCDFGLARIMEDEGFKALETSSSIVKCSLRWCSPELFAGQRTSPRSDIWAWGWLVWEVVTGKLPFPKERTEAALFGAIFSGRLPEPSDEPIFAEVSRLWELARECWLGDPFLRPSAENRSQTLKELIAFQESIPMQGMPNPIIRWSVDIPQSTSAPSAPTIIDQPPTMRWIRSILRRSSTLPASKVEHGNPSSPPPRLLAERASTFPPSHFSDLSPFITRNGYKPVKNVGRSDIWQGTLTLPGGEPQEVALKILRAIDIGAEEVNSPHTKDRLDKRLQREVRVWKPLENPRIVPFLGFATVGGLPCLISPWCKNGNAQDYVDQNPHCNRKAIIVQVAEGLVYLHDRPDPIVHYDVKSLNVLIGDAGEAMLSDFGLAKILDEVHTGFTTTNPTAYTTRCAAPEALDGGDRTTQSDVFSFACFALEMLSGKAPWYYAKTPAGVLMARATEGIPQPARFSGLPAADPLWGVLNQCWARDPYSRPNMKQVLQQLQALPGYRA